MQLTQAERPPSPRCEERSREVKDVRGGVGGMVAEARNVLVKLCARVRPVSGTWEMPSHIEDRSPCGMGLRPLLALPLAGREVNEPLSSP